MKKTLLLSFLLVFSVCAHAQIVVKGTVADAGRNSLVGAIVTEKGTTNAVPVGVNGEFSITVSNASSVLVAGLLGYDTQEQVVGTSTQIDFVLTTDTYSINEVVVTALNIPKQKKTLGYSVQEVAGSSLAVSREANPMTGLVGKVAGMRVVIPTDLMKNPDFLVRGVKPIVVVDGVPISSDTWNISSDDIESINVLKGSTAAALYGSQGMNGAIQITTKRGTSEGRDFQVEFNSTTQFQTGFITIPKVQSSYGSGNNFQYDFGDGLLGGLNTNVKSGDASVWGPRFEGQLIRQYDSPMDANGVRTPIPWMSRGGEDNLKNFIQTGVISTSNVAVSHKTSAGDLRISISNTHQKGLFPNTKLNSTNANISGTTNLGKKVSFRGSLNYNNLSSPNFPEVPYSPQSPIYLLTLWCGPNVDVLDFKNKSYWIPGMEGYQQYNWEYTQYNNLYFEAYENTREHHRDDVHGQVNLNWRINADLAVVFRSNLSTYQLYTNEKFPFSLFARADERYRNVSGYKEDNKRYTELNNDLLANYAKQLTPSFGLKATFGASYLSQKEHYTWAGTQGGLIVSGIYTLQNSVEPRIGYTNRWVREMGSVYGYVDLDFKNVLFLSVTGRMDKSSTLPLDNNSYFYPSVSLSGVLSDMMDLSSVFSFLRVRGSYANVGSDLDVYQLSNTYTDGIPWDGKLPLYTGSEFLNPHILPQSSSSYEVGADMRFFKNRLGFDVTYFFAKDGPQIFSLDTPPSSGYSKRKLNGLTTTRRGFELVVTAAPIVGTDFKWNIAGNLSTTRRRLKDVYGDVDVYIDDNNNGARIKKGERLDQIWLLDLMRSPEDKVIYKDGLPVRDDIKSFQGHYDPDFIFGLANTFTYKNWSLNIGIDGSIGGKIQNGIIDRFYESGVGLETDNEWRLADWEAFKRDPDGFGTTYTGTMVGEGVVVTGGELKRESDGTVISDNRTYMENSTPAIYQSWAARYYHRTMGTNLQDRTWIKLREVTLTWDMPSKWLKKTGFIQKASISFVGRNLLYYHKADFVDVEQFVGVASVLQTPSTRNLGFNVNIIF